MVTGFAAGGLVELVPALAVMLGANVGSTLIVQLLSYNVMELAPGLILIGVLMFRRSSAAPRDFGRVLIGLGLMLMALQSFLALLTPYEDVPSLRMFLGAVATQPMLDVVLAAGLTWAAHSSVAVVLVIMSFAAQGTVPPQAAFALVLGANLGTAINPVLEECQRTRCCGQASADRQSAQSCDRRGNRACSDRADRPPDGVDRGRQRARGGGLPYRVQPRSCRRVSPAPGALRGDAALDVAGKNQPIRSWPADAPGPGGARNPNRCNGRCGARGATSGGRS